MKNILLLTIVALGMTACNAKKSVALAGCTGDTSTYQVLHSGDVIANAETPQNNKKVTEPEVEIFHTEDGVKKACTKSGTAMILR